MVAFLRTKEREALGSPSRHKEEVCDYAEIALKNREWFRYAQDIVRYLEDCERRSGELVRRSRKVSESQRPCNKRLV